METTTTHLTPEQVKNFEGRVLAYYKRIKSDKGNTAEEIVLKFLAARPNEWFFTWELMGATKWGWLSHATHATLRKAAQKGLINKAYIGKYVVYTHKHS